MKNLVSEGILTKNIVVTGNTVIDALVEIKNKLNSDSTLNKACIKQFSFLNTTNTMKKYKIILVTGHRREKFW